jgi:hypothetical protein
VNLCEDLDNLNFQELPEGTAFARVRADSDARFEVWDESGQEVGSRYFVRRDEEIVNAVPLMPSQLTLDERIIRQDCLCYLMERYAIGDIPQ